VGREATGLWFGEIFALLKIKLLFPTALALNNPSSSAAARLRSKPSLHGGEDLAREKAIIYAS
jgi:hypothetical protein